VLGEGTNNPFTNPARATGDQCNFSRIIKRIYHAMLE